jgi:hypothetical protein
MNDKSNTVLVKSRAHWGYYSLILGFISAILPVIVIDLSDGHGSGPMYREYPICIAISGIGIILGLIFGFGGLKSVRKKVALAGVIICVMCALWWIVFTGSWIIWMIY